MGEILISAFISCASVVVGCYFCLWFLRRAWKTVSPISSDRVIEMSRVLRESSKTMQEESRWFSGCLTQVEQNLKDANHRVIQLAEVEDQLREVLESYMTTRLHDYLIEREPELVKAIGLSVAQRMHGALSTRSLQFKNEYVVLNSVDSLNFDIEISMDRVPDGRLRAALIEALAVALPRGEGTKGIDSARAYYAERLDGSKLTAFLNRLGTEVAQLQWKGAAAIQRTGNLERTERLSLVR